MNNQIPYGYNSNQMPMFPGMNEFNQPIEAWLNNLEYKVKTLENKVKKLEEKTYTAHNNNDYNPYQSSMHMM